MKKCFSFLLALTLMLAVCAAASAETITLKIAHNYDFVTIPNSVIASTSAMPPRARTSRLSSRRIISVSTGTSMVRT